MGNKLPKICIFVSYYTRYEKYDFASIGSKANAIAW